VNHAKNGAIIQQQKLQNIILIVIIGFISALGVLQWRNSKKRREVNEKLEEQNQFIQNQRQEIIVQNEKLHRHNNELSDLNHEKDTLMGIVAHDLKSPLNRIKGITDLMDFEGPLSSDQKSYLKMISDATQSGLDLITDLLDVHMLEENAVPNYSSFDISEFILEKTEAFKPAADAKNIHLNITRIESEHVSLDADYLSRIVDNLISNAIKFSRRDSSINVEAWRMNKEILISIHDQGPGFSEKDKALLFQKFKKLSARPTAGETSNGLGLAIVKTLVDRLKGNIELISEQGKGSKFVIKFPVN
jgi:signal transduction histidine kinase